MTDNMNQKYLLDCPPLLRDFLFYMETILGRSARTVDSYYIDLRQFFRFLKGSRNRSTGQVLDLKEITIGDLTQEEICNVTLSDVYAFLNYVMDRCGNNAFTRMRKVSALRSFYKYLNTKTPYLPENPMDNLDSPKGRKSLPRYLSLEESLELLDHVDTKYYERDYCILTFFLNCGMRLSELVGINLTDIRGNTLRLLGKGNKERVVYLNEACLQALENYQKVRLAPFQTPVRDPQALFLSSRGTRLTNRRVEQIVEQCLRTAGLDQKGYSPHKLRHTAATLMYQQGNVDIRVLQEILGHENLGTTEIYTHVADTQLEQAADRSPLSRVRSRGRPRKKELPKEKNPQE